MKTLCSACLIFWTVVGLHAQEADSNDITKALAHTPLFQLRAPEFASWLIDGSGPAGNTQRTTTEKSSHVAGLKINVAKTGRILVQSTVDANDRVWSTWCIGNTEVTLYPNKTDAVVMDGSTSNATSAFYTDYTRTDFPDFAWLTSTNCGGRKLFNGHHCLVFFAKRDPVNGTIHPVTIRLVNGVPSGVPSATDLGVISAYVDEETRLPVGIQEGKSIRLYSFLAPPQAVLVLPDPIQAILNERESKAKAAMRKVPNQP